MFGGGAWDTVTAFFVGLLIEWVTLLMDKFHMQTLVATLAGGFLAAFLPMAVNRLTGALVVEQAVAGALMPMLPGLAMTNAVQDTMRGDMVSGFFQRSARRCRRCCLLSAHWRARRSCAC